MCHVSYAPCTNFPLSPLPIAGEISRGGSPTVPVDVSSLLTDSVIQIVSSENVFAAIKSDGSVVVWGDDYSICCSTSSYQYITAETAAPLLVNVVSITASTYAFAAIRSDGSVVTFGSAAYGGDATHPVDAAAYLTSHVVSVVSTRYAFAALKADGSVISWGLAGK